MKRHRPSTLVWTFRKRPLRVWNKYSYEYLKPRALYVWCVRYNALPFSETAYVARYAYGMDHG